MWKDSSSLIPGNMGILPCPSCGEMIYSDAEECRFCSAPIDRQAAVAGAQLQVKINNACNHAKLIRNGAGVMWLFLLLSSVPFLPFGWGFLGLFIAVPIGLISWQVKYGRLETTDPDFKIARRDRLVTWFMWLSAVVVQALWIVRSILRD